MKSRRSLTAWIFPSILSESRKYALALTVGTQTLTQLPEGSIEAVFGNCATIISFRVSGDDAKALVREFAASGEGPRSAEQMFDLIVPASELQNLPDYKAYVRTLVNGRPQDPYLLQSFPPFPKTQRENSVERVLRTSGQRYGRERAAVEYRIGGFRRFLEGCLPYDL